MRLAVSLVKISISILTGVMTAWTIIASSPALAQTSSCAPLPSSAAHWWRAEGNAQDSVGSNHGTLEGGTAYAAGMAGQGFSFDGIDDLVAIPAGGFPTGASDRTLEAWVKVDAMPVEEAFFAGYDSFGAYGSTYHLGANSRGLFFSSWGPDLFSPSPLTMGQWHHVAVTNAGNLVTLYLDGVPVNSGSLPIDTPPANSQFFIGKVGGQYGDIRRLQGQVDEVTLYARALTSEEIAAIYQAGAQGKCATEPPPVNHPPVLSYSQDTGYLTDGVNPEKGTADLTPFVFKAVYTDQDNDPPPYVAISIDDGTGAILNFLQPDTAETIPITLRDGNYTNGEQYTRTDIFSKGHYQYHFESSDGEESSRLPATGELTFQTGYSNVAFLHGIEGSRLYVGNNQIWLPSRGSGFGTSGEDDIEKLAFSPQGTSIYDVHTKDEDIVNTAFLFAHIYQGFSAFMDGLEHSKVINEWKPIAYDWRLDYFDLIKNGAKRNSEDISYLESPGNGTPYVIDEIQKLAASSDTGRVTIVTHSNGGLLAKTLLSELQKEDNPYHGLFSKIDRLVMVAPPQLGTPKAYVSMLHGAGHPFESFLGGIAVGFFSNIDQAWRYAARNMPMAYDLLPSRTYVELMRENTDNALFVFDSSLDGLASTIRARSFGYAGGNIETAYDYRNGETGTVTLTEYDDYKAFLLGAEGRPEPRYEDIRHPVKLERDLLEGTKGAEKTHAQIDAWLPPDLDNNGEYDIEVIQIAGWGNQTIRGMRYEIDDDAFFACTPNGSLCDEFPGVMATPLMTSKGDETVVLQSAAPMSVETWYVNLAKLDEEGDEKKEHATIMTASPVINLLNSIIRETPRTNILYTSQSTPSGAHITQLEMHSPVEMHVYDVEGNHTGYITDADGFTYFEERIPGSSMLRFGESVYIFLNADETYRVTLDGIGNGTFTLKVKETLDDAPVGEIVYKDIPVTEFSTGEITVGSIVNTSGLSVDYEGDGKTDFELETGVNADITALEYLAMLDTAVKGMDMKLPAKITLQAHIKTVRQLLQVNLQTKNKKGKGRGMAEKKINEQILKILDQMENTTQKFVKQNLIVVEDQRIILRLSGNIKEKLIQ